VQTSSCLKKPLSETIVINEIKSANCAKDERRHFTKNKPSFCQNKKIVAIASHFLKFQAQAVIKTLISSPTCYVGAKVVLGANIILPKKALKRDNRYQRDKKRKLCKRLWQ
jgi:hypothetical protein